MTTISCVLEDGAARAVTELLPGHWLYGCRLLEEAKCGGTHIMQILDFLVTDEGPVGKPKSDDSGDRVRLNRWIPTVEGCFWAYKLGS